MEFPEIKKISRAVVDMGERVIGVLIRGLDPAPQSYDAVAYCFLEAAKSEWYRILAIDPDPHMLRPFEVEFNPLRLRFPDTPPDQILPMVTREIFTRFKKLIPPSDEAYSYRVSSPRTASLATVSYYKSAREWPGLGQYGVGIYEEDLPTVFIFPPGYDHAYGYTRSGIELVRAYSRIGVDSNAISFSPKGEFPPSIRNSTSAISIKEIGKHLPLDPNPQRRFRYIEELSVWEAIAS